MEHLRRKEVLIKPGIEIFDADGIEDLYSYLNDTICKDKPSDVSIGSPYIPEYGIFSWGEGEKMITVHIKQEEDIANGFYLVAIGEYGKTYKGGDSFNIDPRTIKKIYVSVKRGE